MSRSLVIPVATVTGGDIHIILIASPGTESDPAAVVIVLRMIEGEQDFLVGQIGHIRIRR